VVMITGQSINPYRLHGRVTRVLGSGFLIEASGFILTNSHVVYGLQSLTVTMDDGSIVAAKLIGVASTRNDLQTGDVIYSVNRAPIKGVAELNEALSRIKAGGPRLLQIERRGQVMYQAFELE